MSLRGVKLEEIWVVEIAENGEPAGFEIRDVEDGMCLADCEEMGAAVQIAREMAKAQGINHVHVANDIDEI